MGFFSKLIGDITGSNKQAKAATQAAQTQAAATDRASQVTRDMYNQTRSDLQPYAQAGTNSLAQIMQQLGTGGSLNQNYKGDDFSFNGSSDPYQSEAFKFQADPSYAFRQQQGMNGIQGSAAASGGLLSGATLKALNSFNSNLASQEYGNAYDRYLQGEQLGQGQYQQAFNNWQSNDNNQYNRFASDQNNQFSRLYNMVNLGQNAAAQTGSAGAAAAQQIGNNTMAGANATAAGQVAAGNRTANNFGSALQIANTAAKFFNPVT